MSRSLTARALTREAFAPFGDMLDTDWPNHYPINRGKCERFHDLAKVEATGTDARVLLSIFKGTPYTLPLKLDLVERHPFGSQAFMPLDDRPFLVIVCGDDNGRPGIPNAFITKPGQGVNYHRNVWHGVLTPIGRAQDFIVVDRGGAESNLEEFTFETPWEIHLPDSFAKAE